MQAAVRALKLEHPDYSIKEMFAALEAAGESVELSAVKKANSKVSKALAKEAAATPPPPPPPPAVPEAANSARKARKAMKAGILPEQKCVALAIPPAESITFLRCYSCEKPVHSSDVQVCGGCYSVCYCSQTCQLADASHVDECAAAKQHMATAVRVHLPGKPSWLDEAMDHRCESTCCELLKRMGCHEAEAYQLLCGCTLPSATHRYVANCIEAGSAAPDGVELASWSDYYEHRKPLLPPDSPLAVLLTWPLTVYFALSRLGLTRHGVEREVVVHYLGPEKEVMMLPLFSELAVLCPSSTITIVMVGPLGIALPPPITFEGAKGGRVSVSVLKGLYHEAGLETPDLAIAPNAGLAVAGYKDRWPPTLRHVEKRTIPFLFSDYSEQSIEKGLAVVRVVSETLARVTGAQPESSMQPSSRVVLNPFRAPMRLPRVNGGSVGHPTISNGWFACFNTPLGAFDITPSTGAID